jgi:hypothetical protein
MKYALTMYFACLLLGGKAQPPADIPNEDDGVILKTVEIIETPSKTYACTWPPNYTVVVICNKIVKAPDVPLDMMVRHYFGLSYWD